MASKTATTEKVARVGKRRQVVIPSEILETLNMHAGDLVTFTRRSDGVLVKPKRRIDPDDVLTPDETALVSKAEREIRHGKYLTLDQLRDELDRSRLRRSRKTT